MRAFRRAASSVLLLLVTTAGPALASELLVMPYACIMAGGRPVLAPGPEQGHQIIGRREQRTFTACSPANPALCRTWTVHRFDMDCDGTRVPWFAVVAAAADRRSERVWMEDGRLVVRMPRSWSFAEDDPCARRPGFFEGFGRMRRYCEERRAEAPPVVAMPEGFAPMLGIDAVIVKSAPQVADRALPPSSALPETRAPEAVEPPAPAPRTAKAEPPPFRTDPPAPERTPKSEPATPPKAKTNPPPPKAAAPAGAVTPKIINRPETTTATPETDGKAPPQATVPPPAPVAAAKAPADDEAQPTPAPRHDLSARETPVAISLLTLAGSPAAGAFVAFTLLTMALLAAFLVVRRREQLQLAGRPRDVAAAPIYRPRRPSPSSPTALVSRPAAPPVPDAPTSPPRPPLGASMPRTRIEALEVLGMGVMPSSGETAIKKIVDGLRLSWHPDLAKDEADRRLREMRMKQINAAWDILQGRRGEI